MRQNIVSIVIDDQSLDTINGTLSTLEKQLEDLIELTVEQRRELIKLGPRSEVFCRETLKVIERNPGAMPADFDIEGIREDREAIDKLRPILSRLRMLTSRATDTEMALGSDLYKAALDGYRFARASGGGAVLDELKAQANPRFKNNRKPKDADEGGTSA